MTKGAPDDLRGSEFDPLTAYTRSVPGLTATSDVKSLQGVSRLGRIAPADHVDAERNNGFERRLPQLGQRHSDPACM